jgi:tetratricopeptide (TPR) repeat protein
MRSADRERIQSGFDVVRYFKSGISISILVAVSLSYSLGQTAGEADHQRESAIAFEQEGKLAEAEDAWRGFLKAHPGNAEAYANLGLLEARQEHYAEAVPLYRKAMALGPAMPGLRLNLGLSLFKSGAMKEAAATFLPLLKSLPPSSPDALRVTTLIGLARYGAGDYAEAVPYLKKATAADPQNLPFRLTLAQSCLWSKQYKCVLDVYHEIVTLNDQSAEADMLAGEALDEMKDKTGAVEQFRAAVKADPKMPNVHFGLGYLLWGLLRFDEAAKEFQAELDNNPNHAQALTYLADSYIQSNHPEKAPPLLEKAVEINPKIELAHLDLGILYTNSEKKPEALRELKMAEQLNPNDQAVHWRLGRFYKSMGKNQEAQAEFEKTRSLQKAADETVMHQLHRAQAAGKPASGGTGAPPAN